MNYETYPEKLSSNEDTPLYYIEFHNWENGTPITWKLYKRQFICSREEWLEKYKDINISGLMCREGHPWALLEDELLQDHCIPNKQWLKFMVDALNEKVYNDNIKSINCSGGE